MSEDTLLPFAFPAVGRKKVVAACDGGRLTSDGGVMLLAAAERRLGIADTLAALISDPRDPARVTHSLADILRARIFAIACGYADGNDLDHLRGDPAFKLACGRLPDSGDDLCSQPTLSRFENAPTRHEVAAMSYAMIGIWCASYASPPREVTLDIDDTVDGVHGTQQLSLFNSHHGERCLLPIHVYDTATARPVAVLLRAGKTPAGREVRGHIRRLGRRIRTHWPDTSLTIRGSAEWLYATLYCARGQAENLIKLHKSQLASDRTSCRSPLANQVRLLLHTAADWLLLAIRDAIPRPQPLANATFTTLRLRLIKVAARVLEAATRVRIAFAARCPEAALFAGIARWFQPAAP